LDRVGELNYYRRVVGEMVGVLGKKGLNRKYSVDRTGVECFISNLRLPKQYAINKDHKKYWTDLKLELDHHLQKPKPPLPPTPFKPKRSHSCILDYF
jgi:hypothetical protein